MTTETAPHWLTEHVAQPWPTMTEASAWATVPFSVEIDGERWAGATTGVYAVLIREDHPEFATIPRVAKLVVTPPCAVPVDLAAFQAWASMPEEEDEDSEDEDSDATTCSVCDGSGEHWCSTCEDDHECKTCDGTGETEPKRRYGTRVTPLMPQPGSLFGAVVVDRRLVALALQHFDSETATLRYGGALDPVVIATPDWRVIVMPMRVEPDVEMPTWPVA